MNGRWRTRAAGAVAVLTGVVLLSGPAGASSTLDIDEVDVAEHPHVSVVVSAPAELSAADLSRAFTVREGGDLVSAEVERLSAGSLEIVLVIDTSGSMEGAPISGARDAAKAFVAGLPKSAPVAVLGFGAQPALASPFSTDRPATIASIDSLVASGETALYDAVVAAAQLQGAAEQRAIVLLSDGGDTVSAASLDDATAALRAAEPLLSIVELVSPESDHDALVRLASERDGQVVPAADAASLHAAYQQVSADLTGRYRISYRSTHAGSTELLVSLRSGSVSEQVSRRISLPGRDTIVPTAPAAEVVTASWFERDGALFAGGALVAIAATWVLSAVFRRPRSASRLRATAAPEDVQRQTVAQLAKRASVAAERTLERRGARRGLDALLEEAGLALRAGELVVIAAATTTVALLLGAMLGGPLLGIVAAALAIVGTRLVLAAKRDRRRAAFGAQLDELLQMLAGSLRAGYGLSQALETASNELEAPAADELRRVTTEVRLGRDLMDALDAMAARVDNEDFGWVAQAIQIHREVGGDLGEVLDRVGQTIRARGQLQRQVAALSAEGRISALVIGVLPFVIAGGMSMLNPGYLEPLYSTTAGFVLLAISALMMTTGALWLRKLVRPAY